MANPLLLPVLPGLPGSCSYPAPVHDHRGAVRCSTLVIPDFDSLRRRNPARPGHAAAGQLEEPQGPGRIDATDATAPLTHVLVDSHCHLDAPEFDADRDAVIARARAAGVTRQIVPAIDARAGRSCARCCARDDGPVPGLRPASDVPAIASRRSTCASCATGSSASAPSRSANAAWTISSKAWIATRSSATSTGNCNSRATSTCR